MRETSIKHSSYMVSSGGLFKILSPVATSVRLDCGGRGGVTGCLNVQYLRSCVVCDHLLHKAS